MRSRYNFLVVLIVLLSLMLIIVGCGSKEEEVKNTGDSIESGVVPFYTTPTGGVNYILGAGMSQLFNQSKIFPDVNVVTEATSGSSEAVIFLTERYDKGESAFASVASDAVTQIYNGDFESVDGAREELRAVSWTNSTAIHFVVSDKSSIESLADVQGKRIGFPAPPGNSSTDFAMGLLEDGYGIGEDDYNGIMLNHPDVIDGIQNGSIDVGVIVGAVPAPMISELGNTHDVRIVPADEENLNSFLDEHPYYGSVVAPAGTYPIENDEDLLLGTFEAMFVTHEDVSEELVYEFTKYLLENTNEMVKIHPVSEYITPETAIEGFQIPLHPGSKKYYKETGSVE